MTAGDRVAHKHPRKLYISTDTDTPVCIQNIDIWQRKGEKHGHNDGTGDSRRQGHTQAHRGGGCSSGEMQKENIDTKYGNGYYRQRNGQKHGHKEGTGDSRRHKGNCTSAFPLHGHCSSALEIAAYKVHR